MKPAISGGTSFPGPGRRKRPSRRVEAIMQAVRPHKAQGTPLPPQTRLGQNQMPGIGHQLTRRVQSGAIDQDQAQRVAKERGLLKDTYGSDWRRDVYGDRGYMQRTRLGLQENPDDANIQALMQNLQERRKQMLERARMMRQKKRVDNNVEPDNIDYL